jgi:hypothetical protein
MMSISEFYKRRIKYEAMARARMSERLDHGSADTPFGQQMIEHKDRVDAVLFPGGK